MGRTLTIDEINARLKEKSGEDYQVISEYKNLKTPVILKHSCGEEWEDIPSSFLRKGVKCPRCFEQDKKEKINSQSFVFEENDFDENTEQLQKMREAIKGILEIFYFYYSYSFSEDVSIPLFNTNRNTLLDFVLYDDEDKKRIKKIICCFLPSEDSVYSEAKRWKISEYCSDNGIPYDFFFSLEEISYEKILDFEIPEKRERIDLIAIDQATTSGISFWQNQKLIKTLCYKVKATDQGERLEEFYSFFKKLFMRYSPRKVAFEAIIGVDGNDNTDLRKSTHTFLVLAYYQAILIFLLSTLEIPYTIVTASSWKKAYGVTGRFREEQKKSCKEITNRYFNIDNQDVCDAIGIGYFMIKSQEKEKCAF